MPDYLESSTVLAQVRDEKVLARAQRRGGWWSAERARLIQPQRPVSPLGVGAVPKSLLASPRCIVNVTYGSFGFDGADHVWAMGGCRGAFRCVGLDIYCGRVGLAGRALSLTPCASTTEATASTTSMSKRSCAR